MPLLFQEYPSNEYVQPSLDVDIDNLLSGKKKTNHKEDNIDNIIHAMQSMMKSNHLGDYKPKVSTIHFKPFINNTSTSEVHFAALGGPDLDEEIDEDTSISLPDNKIAQLSLAALGLFGVFVLDKLMRQNL